MTVNLHRAPLDKVLNLVFSEQPFTYKISDNAIVIKPVLAQQTLVSTQQTIKGVVTDSVGNPLQGVTITVKATGRQAITDRNGRYEITGVQSAQTLQFRLLSYQPFEIIATGPEINVVLRYVFSLLDEPIVIGYGISSRRLNTGSVAKVSAEEIGQQPISNPLQALRGRVPGMFVQSTGGTPGSGVSVQIRGKSSLTAGTEPLYIIDGVPFDSQQLNQLGGNLSVFNSVNPSDIESIEVLKDADATAIYGSRGANGVVLITTKKGKIGRTEIGVNFYTGYGKVANVVSMMNTDEYLQLRRMAFENDGIQPTAANAPDLILWDTTQNTNWVKELIGNTSPLSDLQLNLSGGDLRTQFVLSGAYRTDGTVFSDKAKSIRGFGKIGLNHLAFNERLKVDLSVSYIANDDYQTPNLITYINLPPNYPLFDNNGAYYWFPGLINPMALSLRKTQNNTTNFISNGVIQFNLNRSLTIKTNIGYNNISLNQIQVFPSTSQDPNSNTQGYSFNGDNQSNTWIIEPQLNFEKTLGKGTLSVLSGLTFQKSRREGRRTDAFNFSDDALLENIASAGNYSLSSTFSEYKYASFFGRVNYNLLDKYIFNLNFRRDGSTRFGPGNQYGNFGALGVAWLFKEEKFLKEWDVLSFGKLRASYGVTGNDQISDYQYISTYSSTSNLYNQVPGLYPTRIANPEFSWESNQKLDIALEVGLFKDNVFLSTNYYNNKSGNQLVTYPLSAQTGFISYQANLPALIENSGWEFLLNSSNIRKENFSWSSVLNFSRQKNKLIRFPNLSSTSYSIRNLVVGQSLDLIWQYNLEGIDQHTGRPIISDLNGDGLLNASGDFMYFDSMLPEYYGGVGNTFTWNNLQLDIFFQFVKKITTDFRYPFFAAAGTLKNQDTRLSDEIWKSAGHPASLPKATTTGQGLLDYINYFNTYTGRYTDGSYLKLNNLQLSYSFNPAILGKTGFSNLRIYMQGQNLFTITKFSGFDPETVASTGTNLPNLRVYTIGISAKI